MVSMVDQMAYQNATYLTRRRVCITIIRGAFQKNFKSDWAKSGLSFRFFALTLSLANVKDRKWDIKADILRAKKPVSGC